MQDILLHNFRLERRNLTIFQVEKATLLCVSDVLASQYSDVFDEQGHIKSHAFVHDQKTSKANNLYLKSVESDLRLYQKWLIDNYL